MYDVKSEWHIEKLGDHKKDMGGVAEAGGDFIFVGAFDSGNVVGVGYDEPEDGVLSAPGFVHALL